MQYVIEADPDTRNRLDPMAPLPRRRSRDRIHARQKAHDVWRGA